MKNSREENLKGIILSQSETIKKLEKQIQDQNDITKITVGYQDKLRTQLQELEKKTRECDAMRREIAEMKSAYNRIFFNGRWNILRHFL